MRSLCSLRFGLKRWHAVPLFALLCSVAPAVPSAASDKPQAEHSRDATAAYINALSGAAREIPYTAQVGLRAPEYVLIESPTDGPFGAMLNPADRALRAQLDLPADHGLVVSNIVPGGPAAQVGLQNNDVLLELNGAGLNSQHTLTTVLKLAGEKKVTLRLIRGGKPIELSLRPVYRVTFGPVVAESPTYYLGVEINLPDDVLRAHVKELPAEQGLVASEVLPDSPAQKAGLKPFDILLECGSKPLSDSKDLVDQVQSSAGKPLTLKVLRNGKVQTLEVTPQPRTDVAGNGENALNRFLAVRWMAQPQPPVARVVPPDFGVDLFPTKHQTVTVFRNPSGTAAGRQTVPFRTQGGTGTAAAKAPSGVEKHLDAITAELADLRRALDDLKKAVDRKGDSTK